MAGKRGIGPKGRAKMAKAMGDYAAGKMRSGSKRGPVVTSRDQAIAIGLSQARKASRASRRK